jgi:4-amino-4-deoxy-L-arabinose transferase-like glycosyltransferase
LALAAAATALALVDYQTRDPDSALHVGIVVDLARQPAGQWTAPGWGGNWNRDDLYREHPAGLFLLSWPLVRLGYPARQAPFVVNAVFQALTILLVQQLALAFAPRSQTRALAWLLLLMPIAFVYRIRANHEQVVLACYVAALLAAERARTRPAWWGAAALAATVSLLVKGAFAIMVPVSCAAWILLRPPLDRRRRRLAWAGIALCVAACLAAAAAYEYVYRQTTREPFISAYLGQQLGLAARQDQSVIATLILQKVRNAGWYAGRILWFSFPWSLAAGWALCRSARMAWRRRTPFPRDAWLMLTLTAIYVAALSLSDRRAERYVFPAYFVVGAAGAAVSLRHSERLRRWTATVARLYPYEIVVAWAATFALALPAEVWHRFPKFKLIDNR